MTIKRAILVVLTALAIFLIGQDLLNSWNQPQIQSRLELYQTNLLLQATALREDDANLQSARKALLGAEPLKTAEEQYQDVRKQAEKSLKRTRSLLAKTPGKTSESENKTLQQTESKLSRLLADLDLSLGILQVEQGQVETALKTWKSVMDQAALVPSLEPLEKTADVLSGLWEKPPQLLPDAEPFLKKNLDGWFENRALSQLYQLQQRQAALQALQAREQAAAEQALRNLAIVGGVPILGCLIGVGILLFLASQWFLRGKQSLLNLTDAQGWATPWDGEVVWQVLILGFFFVGQIALPLLLGILQSVSGLEPTALGEQGRALFILTNYLLLAAGGLGVLYFSIQPFLPLPEGWFRLDLKGNWIGWGLGGYFAALPLVILISLINQKIWQGQGGSNPILPIALEGKNPAALFIFFVTAAIAAPIFEEILFRGFLLSSLTRYFPVWGAIALSSVLFAIAHLSLSEVLPLTVLGMVLGFVYVRSRNLLSSMLLHSLWNSGTLLSLILLGSGQGN
ncbi:MAG: CPBP family glutamic-type intramembrane protease [Leptodesmis sp.]|uniref:CPBP family intramembrane glutamic endopeptidase n=1 Tax=Leptodesmis sp. TaxID=3100501 RepID=UPI003D0BB097